MKTTQTTIAEAEAQGYADASQQFKTQGAFSAGWTWDDAPELNEAYDRGVNRAEAEHNAAAPAQHSPLPWAFGKSSRQIFSRSTGAHIATLHATPLLFPAEKIAPTTEQANANATLIVRACNNAQRLADALAAIVEKPYTIEGQAARIEAGREALAEWSKQ